jgi:spectinomycin phosphotransferase
MREPPRIADEDLRACLREQYKLSPATLEFFPAGRDYDAGLYRVENERGAAHALKVTSRPLYEPRCLVPRYLHDRGIITAVAPIPTCGGALWVRLSDWTAIVYPWIFGDSTLTGMTNEHWRQVGSTFQRIHRVPVPPGGFASLRKEAFDPTEHVRRVRAFETQHARAQGGGAAMHALRSSWAAHQPTINTVVTSLENLAAALRSRSLPCVLCHADLHARNLIRDRAGQVFVIDWDDVMLAPKERDFIFVRPPHADAFFQGYGQVEIDWVASTYFLFERVVQDLLECIQNVCFRKEWGEESRVEAVELIDVILAEDRGHIAAAYLASARLPRNVSGQRAKGSPLSG